MRNVVFQPSFAGKSYQAGMPRFFQVASAEKRRLFFRHKKSQFLQRM
jgi:hypothetical protein